MATIGIVGLLPQWESVAQTEITEFGGTTYRQNSLDTATIASFTSGQSSTLDSFRLTVVNDTGVDWSSYTLQLPGFVGGDAATFGGFNIVGGNFQNAIITPDWRTIGLYGGIVSPSFSFSIDVGVYHQLGHQLTGTPTPSPFSGGGINYELPNQLPLDLTVPPVPDWPDIIIPGGNGSSVSSPSTPPDPTRDWWTVRSRTTVVNGVVTQDNIVNSRRTSDGCIEYANVHNGAMGSEGVFCGSEADFNKWREDQLAGRIPSGQEPIPEPETYGVLFAAVLGCFAFSRRIQRQRSGA